MCRLNPFLAPVSRPAVGLVGLVFRGQRKAIWELKSGLFRSDWFGHTHFLSRTLQPVF
jgi:hypothetical protein